MELPSIEQGRCRSFPAASCPQWLAYYTPARPVVSIRPLHSPCCFLLSRRHSSGPPQYCRGSLTRGGRSSLSISSLPELRASRSLDYPLSSKAFSTVARWSSRFRLPSWGG